MSEEPKISSKVSITMPNGPAVRGTRIVVDGVELRHVSRAVLDLGAGDVAKLELHTFVDVVVEGDVEVEHVHVCPECRGRLEKELEPGYAAIVDTSDIHSRWRRLSPIAVKGIDGEITR